VPADTDRPTLHMIAGPNGAGKTTLYRELLAVTNPELEFVNADELALRKFGHPAATLEESQVGQRLADERRSALMEERKSFITESTFSHPSKLELLLRARELGYRLRVNHVNVRSPEISVYRVQYRVRNGGHPVPEDKIRERYERNQTLIRDAVLMADRAEVIDNSRRGQLARVEIKFVEGRAVRASSTVPAWARALYAKELERFKPERLNPAAASFQRARAIARDAIGEGARTFVARDEADYQGEILGETALHVVQKTAERGAVAHFKAKLERAVAVGERVTIDYRQRKLVKGFAAVTPKREVAREATSIEARAASALAKLDAAGAQALKGAAADLASLWKKANPQQRQALREVLLRDPDAVARLENALDRGRESQDGAS
jgi:predicted ABC-type ATPase